MRYGNINPVFKMGENIMKKKIMIGICFVILVVDIVGAVVILNPRLLSNLLADSKGQSIDYEQTINTDKFSQEDVNKQADTKAVMPQEDLHTELTPTANIVESTQEMEKLLEKDAMPISSIEIMSYEDAVSAGTLIKMQGKFPGADFGTWHIVTVSGVEYYYIQSEGSDDKVYCGFSIVDDTYPLMCDLQVGMKADVVLAQYPNLKKYETSDNPYWNSLAYPNDEEGYTWDSQYDYMMFIDIDNGVKDDLPQYMAMMMKDDYIAAITYIYPTAN